MMTTTTTVTMTKTIVHTNPTLPIISRVEEEEREEGEEEEKKILFDEGIQIHNLSPDDGGDDGADGGEGGVGSEITQFGVPVQAVTPMETSIPPASLPLHEDNDDDDELSKRKKRKRSHSRRR